MNDKKDLSTAYEIEPCGVRKKGMGMERIGGVSMEV